MYKVLLPWIVAIALIFGGSASAQVGPCYGIGGALMSFDDSVDEVEPKNAFFRLGVSLNEYVDLGGEISITLLPDEISDVDFDVDTTFFYLKLNAPLDSGAKIYLMVGPSDVELTGSSGGISISADDSDTGIGFGFETPLDSGAFFQFDYIRYFDDDGVDVIGINFGYLAKF